MRGSLTQGPISGFTLIELLAVIVIVGILAAIIIPVAGRIREQARATTCLANLRQLQVANMLYSDDHKGRFLPMQDRSRTSSQWYYADTDFIALLGEQGLVGSKMKCPSGSDLYNTTASQSRTAYGYNKTGVQDTGGYDSQGNRISLRQVAKAQIPRPSQTIAFADGLDAILDYTASDAYAGEEITISMAAAYRHDAHANVVYWDGRAEALPRDRMAKGTSDQNRSRWALLE